MRFRIVVAAAIVFSSAAFAQDLQHSSEYEPLARCATLRAQFNSKTPINETEVDTARIQQALDNCGSGKSVALRGYADKHVFVTGALELRRGVTLVIERGVTLAAVQNKSAFDRGDGRCAVAGDCKPLIGVIGVTDSAIEGAGVIDGNGFGNLIEADRADSFTLAEVTLKNASQSHVEIRRTSGATISDVKVKSPKRGDANGISITSSIHVSITKSFFAVAGDNVRIEAGMFE